MIGETTYRLIVTFPDAVNNRHSDHVLLAKMEGLKEELLQRRYIGDDTEFDAEIEALVETNCALCGDAFWSTNGALICPACEAVERHAIEDREAELESTRYAGIFV